MRESFLFSGLSVLQTVGQGENSLRKFSKAGIHPCLSLHRALLSILLKSVSKVLKIHKRSSGKFMGARNMGVGVC